MFGMSLEKLVLVMLIAAVLIGPTRLPDYARRLSAFTRSAHGRWDAATTRFERETGLAREQWNPTERRRYDPREIVRDALRDTASPMPSATADDRVVPNERPADSPVPTSGPSAVAWPDALTAPATLARIRPGQKFVVVGDSAHPTRVAIDALPTEHPARRAARGDDEAHSADEAHAADEARAAVGETPAARLPDPRSE